MSINNTETLVKGVMINGPEILDHCISDDPRVQDYIDLIFSEHLNYPYPKSSIDTTNWFIPKEYQDMDIEEFLVTQCPEANCERLIKELELYRKNNMIPVLKTIKYIVDTLRSNKIVWGVGRGSSVASYTLFLLGLHKIDSVKYNLPITEFFKGE